MKQETEPKPKSQKERTMQYSYFNLSISEPGCPTHQVGLTRPYTLIYAPTYYSGVNRGHIDREASTATFEQRRGETETLGGARAGG